MIFLPMNKKMVENLTKKNKKKGPKKIDKIHTKSATESSIEIKGRLSYLKANEEMKQMLERRSVSDSDLQNVRLHAHFYTAAAQRGKKPELFRGLTKENKCVEGSQSRCLVHSSSHSDVIHFRSFAESLPAVPPKPGSPNSDQMDDADEDKHLKTTKKPLTLREKFNARKLKLVANKN